MRNYVLATIVAATELLIFIFFKGSYGKYFFQVMPLLMMLELGSIITVSKTIKTIRQLFPGKIFSIKARYASTVFGMFGFVAIGTGEIKSEYIFLAGMLFLSMCLVGKILSYRLLDELGVVAR